VPLDASLVGHDVGHIDASFDARWLMSYAAGVPDERPELYDTSDPCRPVTAHPLFPVAPEWELVITHRTVPPSLTNAEALGGVHYRHDVSLVRPIVAGDAVTVTARVVSVERRPGGAAQTVALDAIDRAGLTVWRTRMTSVFLGVELVGEPASCDDVPAAPRSPAVDGQRPLAARDSHVRSVDAHVYTECARIWNPIHTDVAVARRAGLAAPILHGTATLARGTSIATELAGVPLAAVRRVAGTFGAMVPLDSTITVRLLATAPDGLWFDVRTADGKPAVRDGYVGLVG
jgi:acyl dehydratase